MDLIMDHVLLTQRWLVRDLLCTELELEFDFRFFDTYHD
jgi:hypothetical protein